MDGIFIGATWSRDMRNMMLLSVLVYLAAWAALTPLFGNHGLWVALLIFLGARSVAFHWRMRRLRAARRFPAQPLVGRSQPAAQRAVSMPRTSRMWRDVALLQPLRAGPAAMRRGSDGPS